MLSLFNSLNLDGGSTSNGNKLVSIANDVNGKFPEYVTVPPRPKPSRGDGGSDPNVRPSDTPDRPGDFGVGSSGYGVRPNLGTRPGSGASGSDDEDINSRSDINQDGTVDAADLTFVLSDFGLAVAQASNQRSDNQDGTINAADLTFVLSNWGQNFDVDDSGDVDDGPGVDGPGDLDVGSDNYDIRPDLGVRPVRPDGEDDGGGKTDPPIVGVVQTRNGFVYPTSRVNVISSPAIPMWIKERNV